MALKGFVRQAVTDIGLKRVLIAEQFRYRGRHTFLIRIMS